MNTQYICRDEKRHEAVAESSVLNGIDYLEVTSADQRELTVYFHHPLPGQSNGIPSGPSLTHENLVIRGGVRIQGIQVKHLTPSADKLTVEVDASGDFSLYTLQLVRNANDSSVPEGFDPELAMIEFSFKASCPSEFDCQQVSECPPTKREEPDIDYLARDFSSFRRLMLDRLSLLIPDWKERNPADIWVTMVEVLAYVGDHLSYYQDAVGTEAYLGTARKRASVRRHARLLDYRMHEGCNARAWLCLGAAAPDTFVPKGTPFATQGELTETPRPNSAVIFESMHDLYATDAHNRIQFYTGSDAQCCLPRGATRALLVDPKENRLRLKVGDLLIFEEVAGGKSGSDKDADPTRRHVVRLTHVYPEASEKQSNGARVRTPGAAVEDPITKKNLVEIEWADEDALPFPFCLSAMVEHGNGVARYQGDLSVARGNVLLADHGQTWTQELKGTDSNVPFRPVLSHRPLTYQGHVRDTLGRLVLDRDLRPRLFDPTAPASSATRWEMRDALPAVQLKEGTMVWHPSPDLLNADRFEPTFVVEPDENGGGTLRFGDDVLGLRPGEKANFKASYRVGNGRLGNVGAETIVKVLKDKQGISSVRNPLPAEGGMEPESMEQVRQFAPQAFRVQERAVTVEDWVEVAQRHPAVQKAAARFQWTGSWTTVFVAIDRKGGKPVDSAFKGIIRSHLERYRISGYDLEIETPKMVPLDIAICVCVAPHYSRSQVKRGLLKAFSRQIAQDGHRGFFHPDNFTFGQPVYLSQLHHTVLGVPGVVSAEVKRFQRWGQVPNGEIERGQLRTGPFEIVQLDNDSNFPERGKIEFDLHGGL